MLGRWRVDGNGPCGEIGAKNYEKRAWKHNTGGKQATSEEKVETQYFSFLPELSGLARRATTKNQQTNSNYFHQYPYNHYLLCFSFGVLVFAKNSNSKSEATNPNLNPNPWGLSLTKVLDSSKLDLDDSRTKQLPYKYGYLYLKRSQIDNYGHHRLPFKPFLTHSLLIVFTLAHKDHT